MKCKKGNWTLAGILGFAGVLGIVIPLTVPEVSKWFIFLGALFLFLAFKANN